MSIAAKRSQAGFTLVELMVTMLIGLFMLAGLVSLVSAMKRTNGTQNSLATLEDNERLATTLMTNVIESTGYYPSPQSNTPTAEFPVVSGVFPIAGQSVVGTGAGTAAAPGDTITLRYATSGTDGVLDCTGNPSAGAVAKTFMVAFSVDPGTGDLLCTLNGSATPTHLVTGLSSMQVYYGVQTNVALNNYSADTYVDATGVTSWANVISVKITLVFKNPLYPNPGQTNPTISFTRVIKLLNKPGFIA